MLEEIDKWINAFSMLLDLDCNMDSVSYKRKL